MDDAPALEIAADAALDLPASGTLIAALRSEGADRFDPARWRYIEALSHRARAHEGNIRRQLEEKITVALVELRARFEAAKAFADLRLAEGAARHPQAAAELQQLFATADFKGVHRLAAAFDARRQAASLTGLVRRLEQPVQAASTATAQPLPASQASRTPAAPQRTELKTLRESRTTWARLSIDHQLAQALQQAPKNAGPINSYTLVLRSLATMRDISPDYLNQFMSYVDTLISLEQVRMELPAKQKKPAARAGKK